MTAPPERRSRSQDIPAAKERAAYQGLAAETRRATAELAGTFALTFVAAGADVIARVSGNEVTTDARAIAPGLLVGAFIYAMGDVSGAHFNPAVTAAFTLRGVFSAWRVPLYWAAQLLGAVGAALLLRQIFGDIASLGATHAHHGASAALVMEIVLSWLLITVILGTATRHALVGPNAAIAVGATIALCGLFALPISGASMNPARSLGPMIVDADLHDAWIYFVGPFTGAALAVVLTWALHGPQKPGEDAASSGDGERQARSC
ncbi:MAG TPA: aquaporin [Dehalococcoidia bacterium]|nr:aquaporin [Dehalococcoidia bacterium]